MTTRRPGRVDHRRRRDGESHGVNYSRGATRRDVYSLAELGTDREEHGVEVAIAPLSFHIENDVIKLDLHAHRDDAGDLGLEDRARQPVSGMP